MNLFERPSLGEYLQKRTERAVETVRSVPASEIRNSSDHVIQEVLEKFGLPSLALDRASVMVRPARETFITTQRQYGEVFTVPAIGVEVTAPYTGEQDLLPLRPSQFQTADFLEAEVTSSELVFEIKSQSGQAQAQAFNDAINGWLDRLAGSFEVVNRDLETWRRNLATAVRSAVARRIEILRYADGITAGLGFPLMDDR